jgi:hypothetical protein
VHDEHGVGRYRGLTRIAIRGVTQDFLHLEYSGGALYLPVYRLGVVHRFVGGSPETVRLDKLGGATWVEKRRRVSAETRKMAEELLQLYAQRRALPGHAFPAPDVMFGEFEESFPFDETPTRTAPSATSWATCRQRRPWIAWCAATSATARPRSPCARRCWPSWAGGKWRCWRPPRSWSNNTS